MSTNPKHLLTPANQIRSIWRNPIHFIAFGFGVGVIPWAPGTFGTLAAIPIYLLLMHLPVLWYLLITVIVIVLSMMICDKASRDLNMHDHPGMVLDEIAGYLLTMVAVPLGPVWVILGFILFRVFDIWKPWPIHWIDRKVHGGFGIVLDDLLAAVYAWVVLQVLAAVFLYYD
ncbi:MAG: phosphatidylglycerophosphatase A [Gammaproteobacteria bacterium]